MLNEGMLFDVYSVLFTLNPNSSHEERSVWRNVLLGMGKWKRQNRLGYKNNHLAAIKHIL